MDFLGLCSCYVVKCHDVKIWMSLVTSFSLLRIVHADWKQCLKKLVQLYLLWRKKNGAKYVNVDLGWKNLFF